MFIYFSTPETLILECVYTTFSLRCSNRSELAPVWVAPAWHFCRHHVNKYRAKTGNRRRMPIMFEPGLRARTTIFRVTHAHDLWKEAVVVIMEVSFYLSLFPSSSPKGVFLPRICFQCWQTNTTQIAGFLTCSLSIFFNSRRKYWINTEIYLRKGTHKRSTWLAGNRKIAHSIKKKNEVSVDSVSWKCH